VNKQSVSPPIPHLHALLTSGDEPPAEVDIFDLLKVSYEVGTQQYSFAQTTASSLLVSSGHRCVRGGGFSVLYP
jgi:hypothetical protein